MPGFPATDSGSGRLEREFQGNAQASRFIEFPRPFPVTDGESDLKNRC
jgi:hypothetical protein